MHIPTARPAADLPEGHQRLERVSAAGTSIRIIDVPAGGDLGHAAPDRWAALCPSPHWGYVLEGSVEVRFAFGERETARAGELFHWPAFHTCWTDQGVRALEFGPTSAADPTRRDVVLTAGG